MEEVLVPELDRSGGAERKVRHDRERLVARGRAEREVVRALVNEDAERVGDRSADDLNHNENEPPGTAMEADRNAQLRHDETTNPERSRRIGTEQSPHLGVGAQDRVVPLGVPT